VPAACCVGCGATRPGARTAGTLFTERGTIVTVFIVSYALTSFLAGYIRRAALRASMRA